MTNDLVISVDNLWKQYRYGAASHTTLRRDLQSWWARVTKKSDPNLPIEKLSTVPVEDRFWALKNISFDVHRGEAIGILGNNGAGKSTLLKTLSRVTAPTKGRIKIKGRLAGILEVGTGFHPEQTGRENIFLNGAILGMTKSEIGKKFDQIVDFSGMEKFIDTPVKRYSSGMYMRLAFSVAAHLDPDILIVDEVLAVGDAEFQKKCLGTMSNLAHDGRTVIFVSHHMGAISQLTNRSMVIKRGELVFNGPSSEAIQFYTSNRSQEILTGRRSVEGLECSRQFQFNPSLTISEIGLASEQEAEINSGDELRMEVLIQCTTPYRNIRFGYSINQESSVLTGFTPSFDLLSAGEHLLTVSIGDLDLAPGNYMFTLTLGTGGLHEISHVYSVIQDFCPFSVRSAAKNGEPIREWDRAWGRVIHHSSHVEINSVPHAV